MSSQQARAPRQGASNRAALRALALFAAVLCACAAEESTQPTWTVPLFRDGTPNAGADALARLAADGSVFVAISDPYGAVRFGDLLLRGEHVSYVDRDGGIRQAAPVRAPQYARQIRLDDRGRAVVLWGLRDKVLIAYDEQLAARWQIVPNQLRDIVFDVGRGGEVAFVDAAELSVNVERMLHYLSADGRVRWQRMVPTPSDVSHVRIADNGDVLAFENAPAPQRWRFAAADGALVEVIRLAIGDFSAVDAVGRDGSAVLHDEVSLVMVTADGRESWRRETGTTAPGALATNGDVVARFAADEPGRSRVMRLEAATGRDVASIPVVGDVVGADDRGVVLIGPTGSPSFGLARFETGSGQR